MPTKTDRILSYLPGTFKALPRPTALYSLVDAFGSELQAAENSLAAIMSAHWVDHADRGAETIDDLARLAALYGLAPRADESVEEFREHLKRYIRTFLEGTVTVQGLLRITAEALALRIDDDYEDIDTWWNRSTDLLVTQQPRGDDAAGRVLGFTATNVQGAPELAATVIGTIDLSGGVDLRHAATLRLGIDSATPVDIHLTGAVADPAAVSVDELVSAINDAMAVADHDKRYLMLRSPSTGPASQIQLQDVTADAAPAILGLAPCQYLGSDASPAVVTGTVDLASGVDLSKARFLRLVIDATTVAEIDCAGADPAATTLDEIRDAINLAFGMTVASHDGTFLTLISPTIGTAGSIAFQQPAAQDASQQLFGPVLSIYTGRDAQAARVTGSADLSGTVDLSQQAKIELTIDAGAAMIIDCAGADPAATTLDEVVATINTAVSLDIASHNGRFITLVSPTDGAASAIVFGSPADGDATAILFGIGPREFTGSAANQATIHGQVDLCGGVDLMGQYFLKLAVDGGPWIVIDLRAEAADPRAASLAELVTAINSAAPANIASHDGQYLILTSPTAGGASRLAVEPMTRVSERRFVSRARIIDEAAQVILGFVFREAGGTGASAAEIRGNMDLSRGVDLRETPCLRLGIDGQTPEDIDCRGPRPRATLIGEIADAINAKLGASVAGHNGKHLTLISPAKGAASRIVIEPPQEEDALNLLPGVAPGTYRGSEAAGVSFVATVDLSGGVDLSTVNTIKLGYDDVAPVEINCAGADPANTSLSEIVIAINVALDKIVATHDGSRLRLTSPLTPPGASSRIVFEVPSAADATATLFGISAPRSYQGRDATAGRIEGQHDLSDAIDLSIRRYLRIAINASAMTDIDCMAVAADPEHATLDEVIAAINDAVDDIIASRQGDRLILTSPTVGTASRLAVEHYTSRDGRSLILGEVADTATGSEPQPTVIEGDLSLLSPVDLSERRLLRLAVDGDSPIDIDISGEEPGMTFATEIVDAINAVIPGIAELGLDNQLRLTSPTAGADSHLAVLPLRYLEVIEYPPQPTDLPLQPVHHGAAWGVVNDGASDSHGDIRLITPQGVVWPALVNESAGWQVRLLTVLQPGESITLHRHERYGLEARVDSRGDTFPLPPEHTVAAPLGAQLVLPQPQPTRLSRNADGQSAVHLINPLTPHIVKLRAGTEKADHTITVAVSEGEPATITPPPPDGSVATLQGLLRQDTEGYLLQDSDANVISRLRPGPDVELAAYLDTVVSVSGPWHPDTPPLMIISHIARLFNVTLATQAPAGDAVEERYAGVTIGVDPQRDDDIVRSVNSGPQRSTLVKAEQQVKETVLGLPQGSSQWRYQDCRGDRFDQAHFDAAHFAGGGCCDRAIFDVSRFTTEPPEQVKTVFADAAHPPQASTEVAFAWSDHSTGAFVVNLPADLPARFGGRFDDARFGQAADQPELCEQTVTEPPDDDQFLVTRLNAASTLVEATVVGFLPQGWQAITMPFRKPAPLTLGTANAPAKLYLSEEGLTGFIEIKARSAGTWGNAITVSARESGPAMFDVEIIFGGAHFENARKVVLGKDLADPDLYLPPRIQTLLQAGPIGVLQAKAAGIQAGVTRNRTEVVFEDSDNR